MITGEIKNKNDPIWDVFFVASITSPIAVLEQMTYIFFMKLLDDKQLNEEGLLAFLPESLKNPTFPPGEKWHNPETDQDVPYEGISNNLL